MTVTLPWPPAKLSPNGSRGHYHAHAAASAAYRKLCAKALEDQSVPKLYVDAPIMLGLFFCPPTKRLADLDNLLARTKHGIDALADALGVNDRDFEYTLRRGEPTKGGKLLVLIGGGA